MAEFVGGEPMAIGVSDPITFENKTDDSFSVDVGIVFHKSGLYRVSVVGKHTSVEIEPERKKGKWIKVDMDYGECSTCGYYGLTTDYCPKCGSCNMEGAEQDGKSERKEF